MRLLLVVLLVGSLLQLAQAPVTAAPAQQTPAAQMTVRAGFDGFGKANGWLPIEVEVRNDGPDIDGEIQIVITDTIPLPPRKHLDKITQLSVASLIGETIQRIHTGTTVGAMRTLFR